jgi:adenylosuccinate lyase
LIAKPLEFTGAAQDQVAQVATKVSKIVAKSPEAANYRPEPIL